MSNFVDGEVRISEPLNLVSIALGGVRGEKAGTSISRVRLDKAGIKSYQKTEEGKCLKSFLMATSSIELDLRQSLRTESVLRYRLGKIGWGNPTFVLLMTECVIFLILGIVMGLMLESLIVAVGMFVFAAVIGLYAAGYIYLLRKNIEKNFHKNFLSRLDRYIDIVRLKQMEDGTYQDESEED